MRTLRSYLMLFFFASTLALAACGDDSSDGNGNVDTGGDAGDSGTPDSGTPDSGTPDSGTPDASSACDNPNTMCFTPLPSSNPTPRVMIERINIADDYVVLKNVNTVDVTLDGWYVCQRPNYNQLPNGITLGPAETIRINLGQSGTDTDGEIFISGASALTREDEIAFFASSNFDSSAEIRVYLRWGSPAAGLNRATQADDAGLWENGTFVPVCGDNTGIIAVGDGTLPIGFRDVPGTCSQL